MQTSFKNVLISEILKTKKIQILSVSILLPLIITMLSWVINIQLFSAGIAGLGGNPWRPLCSFSFESYKFLYPILMVIICFKLHETKQQPADAKQLFILPPKKIYLYCSKAIILIFCLFISLLLAISFIFISGKICSILYPLMHFQDYSITNLITAFFVKLFFFNLSIIPIQLLLNACFKNVIISAGVPLMLLVLGTSVLYSSYNHLFPYSYSFQAALDFENGNGFVMDKTFYWSMLYSVFFFALGALVIRLQRMHSK